MIVVYRNNNKGQNLRDQASGLERNQEGAVDMSRNDSQGTVCFDTQQILLRKAKTLIT